MRKRGIYIILLVCVLVMCLACCTTEKMQESVQQEDTVWKDAIYSEDKSLGEGSKTFSLEVRADDKTVVFDISTDADNLEDALVENKLIEGDKGPYGLYVKKVNGITADYDVDKNYWSLCKDGTPLQTGVGDTKVKGGEHFEFVRTQ